MPNSVTKLKFDRKLPDGRCIFINNGVYFSLTPEQMSQYQSLTSELISEAQVIESTGPSTSLKSGAIDAPVKPTG